jgi:serine/threonine-protein kinase
LDRYVVLEEVARGGMATIHRAQDERLDRVVCVKLLSLKPNERTAMDQSRNHAIERAVYRQFLKEANSLSRLEHPNVLRIYDFGFLEDTGAPFQVCEYLSGGTLEDLIAHRGPLPPDEVQAILAPIAGALAEAHELGIIHRDIKPSNILFTRLDGTGQPKIADFGIARQTHGRNSSGENEDTTSSLKGLVFLSSRWAAPEQILDQGESPATDIYSLALVAASMLQGRPIFDDHQVRPTFAGRTRDDELLQRRVEAVGLPDAVQQCLLQALRVDPTQRFATMTEFATSLRRTCGSEDSGKYSRPASSSSPVQERETSVHTAQASASTIVEGDYLSTAPELAAPASPSRIHREPPTNLSQSTADGLLRVSRVDGKPEATVRETRQYSSGRTLRTVYLQETCEISWKLRGFDLRLRLALAPNLQQTGAIHIKGLSCFIRTEGRPPSAAITTSASGTGELIVPTHGVITSVRWAFPESTSTGHSIPLGALLLAFPSDQRPPALAFEFQESVDVLLLSRVSA